MAGETGGTTSRLLNRLQHDMANVAVTIGTAATGDYIPIIDVSDDYKVKYAVGTDLLVAAGLLATTAEINRAADVSTRIVNLTAATLAVTEAAHDSKTITINKADGTAITLPAASGSGARFRFFIGTTITSVGTTIKVANASDTMVGGVIVLQDAGDTVVAFEASGTADTITLNGTTTGGIKGDEFIIEDVATNLWKVWGTVSATGTEATPFSATV